MDSKAFEQLFDEQVEFCREILFNKASEYATDDERLHNFIVAGHLQGQSPTQALGGMMSKHTISVYDMIDVEDGEIMQDAEKWAEKITDHLNYLFLLRATVYESQKQYRQRNLTIKSVVTGEASNV